MLIPLENAVRELPSQPFFYCIHRIKQGSAPLYYVGQAFLGRKRFTQHLKDLRAGKHHCDRLQKSFNSSGIECFFVEVLELAENVPADAKQARKAMAEREQLWIDLFPISQLMNSLLIAESRIGLKHTPESRAKMSASGSGKPKSEEHRRKISEALKGKKKSPQAVARSAAGHKGISPSQETRAKMSASRIAHLAKQY